MRAGRETINSSDINQVLNEVPIPPQPELLVKIDHLLKDDEPNINLISSLVAKDVAVSAAVLKIINSPLFNLPKEVLNIRQATLYLGIGGLVSLVKAMLLKQSFKQEQCCITLGRFWDTADEVATINLAINRYLNLSLPVDFLYVLGLFHDAGIAIFASTYSDYKLTLTEANKPSGPLLYELEQSRYGTDHCQLGKLLAKLWNLPDTLGKIISKHHSHEHWLQHQNQQENRINAVFQLTEALVHKIRRGSKSNDWHIAKAYVLTVLELTEEDVDIMQNELFALEQS